MDGAPLTQTFFVPGPLPGMNEILKAAKGFRGRGIGYSRLKAQWDKIVSAYAKAAKLTPAIGPVTIDFYWIEPNARRDRDNVAAAKKFAIDGLVTAGVLPGDGPKVVVGFSDKFGCDKARPGVWVTLTSA